MTSLTTTNAVAAVAWERAPRYERRSVNRRIVCADGFKVSVQASSHHYAHDMSDEAPYWSMDDPPHIEYPFRTFEIGNPTGDLEPAEKWAKYDNDGIWAYVPRSLVAKLLNRHGGAVAWEETK